MLMIDGDYPMADGGVNMERDLTLPIDQVRSEPIMEGRPDDFDRTRPGTMASIPEMRRSGMAVALVKINRCIDRGDTESFCGHAGHAHGEVRTDLDYVLDSNADVDMNVVMTSDGGFVEVQGTGEESTYTREELDALIDAATAGITKLHALQASILANER